MAEGDVAAAAILAQEIPNILPHRFPFLMIDRVREVGPDRIVAIKNVSWNEPFFQGHFPGMPIMPGPSCACPGPSRQRSCRPAPASSLVAGAAHCP